MLRVLIISDDPLIARRAQVEVVGSGCECEATTLLPTALRRLMDEPFDVVAIDRPEDAAQVHELLKWFQLTRRCGYRVIRTPALPPWSRGLLPPDLLRARVLARAVRRTVQRFVEVPYAWASWSSEGEGARA